MHIIGVIGAMEEEIIHFIPHMQQVQEAIHAGITFRKGRLHDADIVLVQSGIGKVNASVCAQILIDRFACSHIIFTGVAGALHPDLDIGDIVISKDLLHHDMDVTALNYPRGVIPGFATSEFAADHALVTLAEQAAREVSDRAVMTGRILSGDTFVADRAHVKALHTELGGLCTEMEGAAVAQVAYMNDIPFVVIRSMSDKADGSAHVNFREFSQVAAQKSYAIVERMIVDIKGVMQDGNRN